MIPRAGHEEVRRPPPDGRDLAGAAGSTIPALLAEHVRTKPDETAFCVKRRGRYEDVSWVELHREVQRIALGLRQLGVEAGDRVALMCGPRSEALAVELAIWCSGAVSVGIHPLVPEAELREQLAKSAPVAFVAEDHECLEVFHSIAAGAPPVAHTIVIETSDLFLSDVSGEKLDVLTLEALRASGDELALGEPEAFERLLAAPDPDDPVTLVSTSGVDAPSRLAIHSHRTLLHGARATALALGPEAQRRETMTARLPTSDPVGKLTTVMLPLLGVSLLHFPEDVASFGRTVFEVAPTYLHERPRAYQHAVQQVAVAVASTSRLKRGAYRTALRIGARVVSRRWTGRRVSPPLRALYYLARAAVFSPLLRRLGYHRVRLAHVGWAAVPPEVLRTWQVWGVDARVVYGLAETAGVVATQELGFAAPSDALAVVPEAGLALELGPDGELLVRLPHPFPGYWDGAPEDARDDGLLATGDRAVLEDDGVRLAGAPAARRGSTQTDLERIECAVKASPFLREAAAVVEPDGGIAVFVEVSGEVVASWAQSRQIAYASFTDLTQRPEVEELARSEVAKASDDLAEPDRVRRVRVLPFELYIGSDLLTVTGKVRRNAIRSAMEPDLV